MGELNQHLDAVLGAGSIQPLPETEIGFETEKLNDMERHIRTGEYCVNVDAYNGKGAYR